MAKTMRFTILAAAVGILTSGAAAAGAQVREQAQVPGHNGSVSHIELLKTGKHLETVSCRDFGMLEESFRPQAVVYAAGYTSKGKPKSDVTVDGVETIVPVVVQQCNARPGDQFIATVNRAMAAARR